MIKLVWLVSTLTASGPVTMTVPENTVFEQQASCSKFGSDMTPRMEDWIRGAFRADWDQPVEIRFRCEPAGERI